MIMNSVKIRNSVITSTALLIIIAAVKILYTPESRLISYLSETNEVTGNILVVEGWLPQFALEKVVEEFSHKDYDLIITTGLKSPELDFFTVARNGYLIFYTDTHFEKFEDTRDHLIEILAHSKMGGNYCAHFNLFINDSLISDFTADEEIKRYGINWRGSLNDIDSIMVHFDNDLVDEGGDRNLYVKEIAVDSKIYISYQFNTVYDIGRIDGVNRTVNDYDSHSELARNELIAAGIDSVSVIAVKGKRTEINRTLNSAKSLRKWLKTYEGEIEGINIITLGIHSRRTLMTFRNVLGRSTDIGVISIDESIKPGFQGIDSREIFNEFMSLIYYRIILFPYYLI